MTEWTLAKTTPGMAGQRKRSNIATCTRHALGKHSGRKYSLADGDSDGIWDPTELRTCLIDAADDLGALDFDRYYGYGLADAEESVTGIETNP